MVAAWITVDDLVDPISPYAQDAVDSASWLLFTLSGRKYGGVSTTTEIYCQVGLDQIGTTFYNGQVMLPGPSGYQIYPELRYGAIINRIGGCCSDCGCTHLIRLRGTPVLSVTSVRHGDRSVPLSEVGIYDYSYITALDQCWFTCDDLEVTYSYGAPPPAMGRMAARALADQYVLAMAGDDECALPQRVTQISRQGVSWTLLDPQDFLDKGRTGIYQVDLFLAAVNPDGARLRSRVFSPDMHRGKTRRSAAGGSGGAGVGGQMMPVGVTPYVAPVTVGAGPTSLSMSPATAMLSAPVSSPSASVPVYQGRPLRWVVPGSFTQENPPVITVRPSGREVPPAALLWRTNNYTLDLTAEEAAELLPSGSALVVSKLDDQGSTTSTSEHPVERRTL